LTICQPRANRRVRVGQDHAVEIDGRDVTAAGVAGRRAAGIAYVPEDRAHTGTALRASATDTLSMGFHGRAPLSRRGVLDRAAMRRRARDLIARFGVKIPGEDVAVGTLSGGNLQKVVVARELDHQAPVLIAEQPTRGVDVGAIEFIHKRLIAMRDQGKAVLVVSVELDEIRSLSDRILVMFAGRIVGERGSDATEGELGLLMAGVERQEAAE